MQSGPDDARESRQAAVVEVDVGERDQPFVTGAVVPLQHPEVDEAGQGLKDALVAGVAPRDVDSSSGSSSASGFVAGEEDVGGSWRSSPATTSCLPRRIAGMASAGRTWLASSKTTTSK